MDRRGSGFLTPLSEEQVLTVKPGAPRAKDERTPVPNRESVMSIATSGSQPPARSMQAIIKKIDSGYTVTTVLSIDGQVRVLSEKTVGSADEAEEVAHALTMANISPGVEVELLYR